MTADASWVFLGRRLLLLLLLFGLHVVQIDGRMLGVGEVGDGLSHLAAEQLPPGWLIGSGDGDQRDDFQYPVWRKRNIEE